MAGANIRHAVVMRHRGPSLIRNYCEQVVSRDIFRREQIVQKLFMLAVVAVGGLMLAPDSADACWRCRGRAYYGGCTTCGYGYGYTGYGYGAGYGSGYGYGAAYPTVGYTSYYGGGISSYGYGPGAYGSYNAVGYGYPVYGYGTYAGFNRFTPGYAMYGGWYGY